MTEREELPMPTLNFTHFSGAVPKYQGYSLEQTDGVLYFVPESLAVRRYDPFEDIDSLLLDVVKAGAVVAASDPFLDYCLSHKMLPLRDAEFWLYGDFFTAHPSEGQPIVDVLLDFAGRYGLPIWEEAIVSTTYPARYAQRCMATHSGQNDDIAYMLVYKAAKRRCLPTAAVPICTMVLTLLDFYLRFVEGVDNQQFRIRNADWLMACGQEKTPMLYAQVYDLTTCINLAYVTLTTGQGKAIRQCKHCQKFFIAEDWRSEYCSPRCRGAYNSKMTRKRLKKRKLREEQ